MSESKESSESSTSLTERIKQNHYVNQASLKLNYYKNLIKEKLGIKESFQSTIKSIYEMHEIRKQLENNEEFAQTQSISYSKILGVGVFSTAFLVVPLGVYLHPTAFNKFCSFHDRVFKLKTRRPASLLGIAFVLSMVYSSLGC